MKSDSSHLAVIAPEMYEKLDKIAQWLESNAAILEQAAKNHARFQSIAEDELANANNYKATATDIRKLLAKAEG